MPIRFSVEYPGHGGGPDGLWGCTGCRPDYPGSKMKAAIIKIKGTHTGYCTECLTKPTILKKIFRLLEYTYEDMVAPYYIVIPDNLPANVIKATKFFIRALLKGNKHYESR